MTRRIFHLLAVLLLAACGLAASPPTPPPGSLGADHSLTASNFYVDAVGGSDGNDGLSPEQALQTLAALLFVGGGNGAGTADDETINLSGTFREQLKIGDFFPVGDRLTIRQWPGMPQAIIRGDTVLDLKSANWTMPTTAGVFEYAIPAATCDWWNSAGTDKTLMEGICDVVKDWDDSFEAPPPSGYPSSRHYGHLVKAPYTACANNTIANGRWAFIPHSVELSAVNGAGTVDATQTKGGGGILRIRLDAYPTLAEFRASGIVLAYVIGNRNGIEIGTPNFTTYPTNGSYAVSGTTYYFTLDGIHVYLFSDGGYRQNAQAFGLGLGDDMSGYGAGTAAGTHSMGYGIRPANHMGGTIKNCKTIDCGYHGIMFVGNHVCKDNTVHDCEIWGGGLNPISGNSSGIFYGGDAASDQADNHLTGCRAYRVNVYKYTHLGTDAKPIPYPVDATDVAGTNAVDTACSSFGFIVHTNVTANNHIRDIEITDCNVYESGDQSLTPNGGCVGGALIAGNQCEIPSDPLDWRTYPVRYVRCNVYNGSTNTHVANSYVAYVNCRLHFERLGQRGFTNNTPNLSANHQNGGLSKALYVGCEIVVEVSNSDAENTLFIALFGPSYTDASNNNWIGFINSSIYATNGVGNAQKESLFAVNSATVLAQEHIYLRGNIIGYRADHANAYLIATGKAAFGGTGEVNAADNIYHNIHTGQWIAPYISGPDFRTAALYLHATTGVDKTGINNGATNPYADVTGASLEPTVVARAVRKVVHPHTARGVNGPWYSGQYGAWQYLRSAGRRGGGTGRGLRERSAVLR